MSSNKFGLSAVSLSAIAAAVSLALPSAIAQSPVMLTPKEASLAGISVAPESARDYEVSNLIVKFRAPTSDLAHVKAATNMRALSAGVGIRMKSVEGMSGGASVVALEAPMSLTAARAMAASLAADPAVEYAEPDIVFKPSALPIENPEFAAKQWNWAGPLDMYTGAIQVAAPPDLPPLTSIATGGINMAAAWDLPVGGNEVVIAVIDTGIINHPDLNGSSALTAYVASPRFLAGYDFVTAALFAGVVENDGVPGRDPNPTDPGDGVDAATKNNNAVCYENRKFPTTNNNNFATPNTWHGTRTAGIIAATADNTIGMAGIASKANIKILPVRALGRCGGSLIDIVEAITWASGGTVATVTPTTAPTPAKVINVGAASEPGIPCPDSLRTAITAAIGRGAVVVAPTGNNYATDISAPANCPGVIAVTAHAINGESAQYTNIGPDSKQGPNPTISAPGGGRPARLGTLDPAVDNPRWAGFSVWSTGRNVNALEIVRANNPNLNGQQGEEAAYVFSGTSDAAAQVSGIVALILAKKNTWNSTQVTDLLVATARPFPALGSCGVGNVWAGQCGAGMVDALRALQATDPPVVVTQPAAVSVPAGQTATFTVAATGVTTYQWTRAGVDIPNTNVASYTTPALAATDNNVAYAVKLINPAGTTTSAAATVTVTGGSANSPSGGGALPAWQLLLLSALLLAARVRVAYREQ